VTVRPTRQLLLVALLVAAAGCAAKVVPPPVVTTPRYPQFMAPDVPAELASTLPAWSHDRGWRFLQAGDLRSADQEFGLALRSPDFYPAWTGRGYLLLARDDARGALEHFDRALSIRADYLSAMLGQGEALLALNREADAAVAFERALAVNPSLNDVRRRVEVLRFQALERDLAAARQAAQSGRAEEAASLYRAAIAASPDSPFLYRELGLVEARRGQRDAALERFRRAVELDPNDAVSLAQIGQILEDRGELAAALASYDQALALEPEADVSRRRAAVSERIELAKLPDEYRAIPEAPRLTRGELAALIGVRLGPVIGRGREAVVVTDVRSHWAEPWIMTVVSAGAMRPFENHTFQPGEAVDRAELAGTVARLLPDVAPPERLNEWRQAIVAFADVQKGHLAYEAASLAVASGVLARGAGDSFEPSREVTGSEGAQAIERLRAMTPLGATTANASR
jgi:tetratricopeptide (TPR) repeat protein